MLPCSTVRWRPAAITGAFVLVFQDRIQLELVAEA
jgi:hypothetical protein